MEMQSLTRCDCLGEGGSMGNFGNICKHRIKTPSLAMSRGCGETRLLPHPGEEFGNIHIKYRKQSKMNDLNPILLIISHYNKYKWIIHANQKAETEIGKNMI